MTSFAFWDHLVPSLLNKFCCKKISRFRSSRTLALQGQRENICSSDVAPSPELSWKKSSFLTRFPVSTDNLKSQFCLCQAILRRYRTSAVAVTTLSLLGCENTSHEVLPSQSSCYISDNERRIAVKNPWEKKGKGHWADELLQERRWSAKRGR